ncbi:hypothetical protein FRB91_010354 [Serendipita sp. 411]|nr:hypothetical protein FRB91_010354 [Serendipita sp. 411]
MYRECLILDEALQEAHLGVQRCEKRVSEQKDGSFDWNALFKETISSGNELDVANFVGPIKIAPLSNRGGGRGIVATRSVVAGELLLVAKPFAVPDQGRDTTNMIIALNFLTGRMNGSTHLEVIQKCILKLSTGSDDATRDFYDLYAGDEGQYASAVAEPTKEPRNSFPRDIDPARIEAVCSLNWFGIPENRNKSTRVQETKLDGSCALYILPSYFNHACASNANRFFFRSVMIVRASRDIAGGTEITHSYCLAENTYQERKQVLPKWFPECDCSLCTEDRTAGPGRLAKRESLNKRSESSELGVKERFDIIQQLNASYPPTHGSFRPALANAHLKMARELESMSLYTSNALLLQRSIEHYIFTLESWEIKVIDRSVEGRNISSDSLPIARNIAPYNLEICAMVCMVIFRAFSLLCDKSRAEKWLRAAVWMESVTSGGDIHVLKLRHAKFIEVLDEQACSLLKEVEASR